MQTRYVNMVAIGGGHGLGKVLNTFSDLGANLTGIVATTDNGGSTGKIRDTSDSIAWGDLRNCIAHLASNQLGSDLLNYRFQQGEMKDHCLGNLIFHALEQLTVKPVEIIEIVRRILRIESRLYPMSEQPTHLQAHTSQGLITGELQVDNLSEMPQSINLTNTVTPPNRVIRAIQNANVILIGPGSFLTSVMPALLVDEIYQAISLSNAKKILIDNLAPEHGTCQHTNLNDRFDFLYKIRPNLKIDFALTNASSPELNPKFAKQIKTDLNSTSVKYRHDEQKLRNAIYRIITNQMSLAS